MNRPADSEVSFSHAPPAAQPPDAQLSAAAPQLMSQPLDAQPPIATAQLVDVPPRRPTWFRDGEGRPRTFWRLFFFSWAFLFGQIVAMIGGLILMLVGALLVTKLRNSGAGVGGRPVEEMLNENELLLLGMTGVIAVPIALGTIWLFRRFLDRRPMMDIGFRRPVAWRWGATSGAIIGTLLMAATVGMATLAGGYRWAGLHAPWTALGLFIPLLAAAFYEELMFRGYLFRNFVEIGRTNLGIWLPSLVFWLVHGMNPNAWTSPWIGANLFLAGVLLTLACHRSGNLWFPTTLHFMWNYAQGPIFGQPVSGVDVGGVARLEPVPGASDWLTGGAFGPEASFPCFLVLIISIAVFARIKPAIPGPPQPQSNDATPAQLDSIPTSLETPT